MYLVAKTFYFTSDKPHYENVPFEVPSSWVWTTVGEISQSILYGVSESAKSQGTYRLLRITDIQDNKVNWDTVPFTDYENEKAETYLLGCSVRCSEKQMLKSPVKLLI